MNKKAVIGFSLVITVGVAIGAYKKLYSHPFVSSMSRHIASAGDEQAASKFRTFYRSALGKKVSDSEFEHLIYGMPQALKRGPEGASSSADYLKNLAQLFKSAGPSDVYQSGVGQSPMLLSNSFQKAAFEKLGPSIQDRLTLVIIPGFMSEFTATGAFDELFEDSSSVYRKLWRERLARAASDLAMDQRYSLRDMKDSPVSLSETMSASSMDWQNSSMVNLVRFDFNSTEIGSETESLSMESIQNIREVSRNFMRRLNKFFKIVGTPKNIAFVGYSRGTPIGLEMLARANENPSENPWIKNVRGMVALGGVVYGADSADPMFEGLKQTPVSHDAQALVMARELADTIQPIRNEAVDDPIERFQILNNNNRAWKKFLSDAASYMKNGKDTATNSSEGGEADTSIGTSDFTDLDPRSILKLIGEVALKSFRLDFFHFFSDYNMNVYRMKALVNTVLVGAQELSTEDRLKWWRANIVPTRGVKYYSVAATMSDPKKSSLEAEMSHCAQCFNVNAFDYKGKIGDYRSFRDSSGFGINDGTMTLHKAIFWPELNSLLNPKQPLIEAAHLGTVATHHYGLALRVVNRMKSEEIDYGFDPYPRAALLKAIAGTIVMDIEQ